MLVKKHAIGCCIIFFILLIVLSASKTSKINKRRLLLPYNTGVPTNYTLEILNTVNGCYTWASSIVQVAVVEPIYDEIINEAEDQSFSSQQRIKKCSSKALVTVTSRLPKRLSTVITAQDTLSSTIFRADVDVDVIKSIEIITTTKKIALEDIPDIIEVSGKDDKNDTFTSLGGVEFDWKLSQISNDLDDKTINLKFKKFSESQFKVPADIEYWESKNSQGSMVLIEGIKTGATKLTVKIKDPTYIDKIKSPEINLVVIANIALIPSFDVYLIPYSNIKYSVQMFKSGKISYIKMPSNQYVFELLNNEIAHLSTQKSIVTAFKEGSTSLILKDTNIKFEQGISLPTTEIHIMKPSYIVLKINPGVNFSLQEYTNYEIIIEIYDEYHHKMYPSENLYLKINFPTLFFHVNNSTSNQSKHLVRTINIGKCTIIAQLIGATKEDGSIYKLATPIEIKQEITIYPKLSIIPQVVFLPWDEIVKPTYHIYLTTNGGTGSYAWQSSNIDLTSVQLHSKNRDSSKVIVSVTGKGEAQFNVTDVNNYVFTDLSKVLVKPVVEIEIVSTIVETHLNEILHVSVALLGYEDKLNTKLRAFDECLQIPLEVDIVEKTRFSLENTDEKIPGIKNSCKTIQFKCKSVGHSRVWIKYENGLKPLKTSVVINCHLPLRLIYPENYALLALGTSMELAFEGGPKPWPLNKEHYTNLIINDDFAKSQLIIDPYRYKKDLHVFRITCVKLGKSNLVLEVGNNNSATLLNPAVEKIKLDLFCEKPDQIVLKVKLKSDENCPLINLEYTKVEQKIPVSSSNDVQIEIFAKNGQGKRFHNISSISVDWKILENHGSHSLTLTDFEEEVNGANGYQKLTRNFIKLSPFRKEGDVIVNANLNSYKQKYLENQGIYKHNNEDFSNIKSSFSLTLVEKHELDNEEISIFNYFKNKAVIQILKGSGHFQIEPSSFEFANITYSENTKRITITPLKDGIFTIKVNDNCVDFGTNYPYAIAVVKIVNPSSIRIMMADKIELGKEVTVKVTLLDAKNKPISSKFHSKINLQPVLFSNIASIRIKPENELSNLKPKDLDEHSFYTFKADKVGTSTIQFKTGGKNIENFIYDKIVTSSELTFNIFEPLHIVPNNLTLIVGARYQVSVLGGPQLDSNNVFTSKNNQISFVDKSGVVNAIKIGLTSLTSKSIGPNNLIYSQYTSIVNIVALKGIKLISHSKNILVGNQVSVTINGIVALDENGKTTLLPPSNFGNAIPNLKIKWIVSNKNIIQIKSIYDDLNLNSNEESNLDLLSVRIQALQPGEATVKAIVSCSIHSKTFETQQIINNQILSDEISIKTLSKLELVNIKKPYNYQHAILMSPNSQIDIKTIKDSSSKVFINLLYTSNNKIKLLQNSIIKAEDIDEAIVEIKSSQEFGITQVLLYKIICKPVAYFLVRPISSFKLSNLINNVMPVGVDIHFKIDYYDLIGNKFLAVNKEIDLRPSTMDILSYKINRNVAFDYDFSIKILTKGLSVLLIKDKNLNSINEYLSFRTSQLIVPSNEKNINLTVGDVLCFTSSLTNDLNDKGYWNLEKKADNIISIDEKNGIVIAKTEGSAKVKHILSSHEILSSEIKIDLPKNLDLDIEKSPFISNHFFNDVKKQHLIPILIEKNKNNLQDSNCDEYEGKNLNITLPFTCELSFNETVSEPLNTLIGRELTASDLFNCDTIYNFVNLQYYVRIVLSNFYLSKPDLNIFLPSFENNIQIKLNLGDKNKPSIQKLLPFYSKFQVNLDLLTLSNKVPFKKIVIQTNRILNKTIDVIPANEATKNIIDIYKLDSSETLTFEVQLKKISALYDDNETPYNIKIFSSLSKQVQIIPLKLKLFADGSNCPRLERESILNSNGSLIKFLYLIYYNLIDYYPTGLTILASFVLLIVGYQYLNRSNENNVPLLEMHHFSSSVKNSRFSISANMNTSNTRSLNYSQTNLNPNLSATSISPIKNLSLSPRTNSNTSNTVSPSSPRTSGRPLWSVKN